MSRTAASPVLRTVPVLAIVVCHDGENWLPLALSALRRSGVRPRHVLAVDTGSTDGTAKILADAASVGEAPVLDGILTLSRDVGFGAAVGAAVEHAVERWGDPGGWLWLLHDDCAPEPDCLENLLAAAENEPEATVLGPLAVDWSDPRLIVEAGLSTDAIGHRQQISPDEDDTAVLAVPSAGSLVRREVWHELGGYDPRFPLLREDLDFGWRANAAGGRVLSVPSARLRHARALSTGQREPDALGLPLATANRAHGLRVFLVNCSPLSFWFGLFRIPVFAVLRALAFLVLRRTGEAGAELAAAWYLLRGRGGLRAARAERRKTGRPGRVGGLFTGRMTRVRNAVRAGVVGLVRRGVERDFALGTVPESVDQEGAWIPPEAVKAGQDRPVGPGALPAGAMRGVGSRGTGLRRPSGVVAVAVPEKPAEAGPKPSPVPRDGGRRPEPELVFVEVDRNRVLGATVFAPPVIMLVVLTALAFVINGSRLGLDLFGGKLLPVGGLGEIWSSYLAPWHAISGGTASPAPATLPVLGTLGALFAPIGGPAALVAILLIGDIPLAALSAYAATRHLRVRRWVRAVVAAAYGVLPAATASVAQGRLDVVVVHLLLPLVIAGLVGLLVRADSRWLHVSALSAIGLALIGAFSPLAYALALVGLLIGFVVLPSPTGLARRVASVGIVVFLPLALLLPWPSVLLRHPELLLHGLGGGATAASGADLAGLDPGGPGAWPIGVALVAAAIVALVVRPSKGAAGGVAVVVLGVLGLVAVRFVAVTPMSGGAHATGYAGVPLLVISAGLLWTVLATWQRGGSGVDPAPWLAKVTAVAGVLVLLALATGAVVAGREGPLRAGARPSLAPEISAELASSGRSVLVIGDVARQTGGRLPSFGDDELAPTPGSADRLASWRRDLLQGSPDAVKQAFAAALASGVSYVVLPSGADGGAFVELARDLVVLAEPTSDGRPVLRLLPAGGQVALISPELAQAAVTGKGAPGASPGVAPVQAGLPDVRVRVSEGPTGRLLVLAAEFEAGWQASVDGKAVPIVRAWGHQVAVSVPATPSEVVVEHQGTTRNLLLLAQVAAVLFTLLTAVPTRRRSAAS
ncbi:glycosyltransferase family 2 protein [Amycolatopsis roodepoortensis]|uniref:glycosyltransferase family 2 protein n=1 Tax=Amycolatopsis roodepoortensis TaxID=700274 RepID=UPI00214C2607|nr:glycosyltransferase family 2 protein [Amycolatopsis roodepoortensis]UUV29339.1 glycosyltransferase family 2 protein [Amycolatopsis roodepoortensis]